MADNGTPSRRRTLTLSDGEARQVRFTFGTIERMREKTGFELEDFRDREKMTLVVTRHLPTFIWAALVKDERQRITPEEIADLIDFSDLPRITEELMASMGGDGPANPILAAAAAVNLSESSNAGPSPEWNSELAIPNSGI